MNHRAKLGFDAATRADIALKGISGKRLIYRRTNAAYFGERRRGTEVVGANTYTANLAAILTRLERQRIRHQGGLSAPRK